VEGEEVSKSKKPRKPYRPKGAAVYGGLPVLAGRIISQEPLTDEQQTDILTDYYTAIDALTQGRAEFSHFEKLVYAVNVTRVLADMGFGAEYDAMIQRGMAAVQTIKDRHARTGKWGIDGDGRKALYDMEDLHRAQLEVATKGEIGAAIAEMWRRIKAGIKFELGEVHA
jgi:hypothetical protein